MAEQSLDFLSELEWLAGRWIGRHGSGQLEEIWMFPQGKSMLGMSRMADGERTFSVEFLLLEQQGDQVLLTLTLPRTGRTEMMRLTSITIDRAIFEHIDPDKKESLIYQRESDDWLTVVLEKYQDDRPMIQTFKLKQVP